jgi:hypothetical protein
MEKVAGMNHAVPVMEAGPPGSPCRRGAPNRRKLRWFRAGVVSVAEKARCQRVGGRREVERV